MNSTHFGDARRFRCEGIDDEPAAIRKRWVDPPVAVTLLERRVYPGFSDGRRTEITAFPPKNLSVPENLNVSET